MVLYSRENSFAIFSGNILYLPWYVPTLDLLYCVHFGHLIDQAATVKWPEVAGSVTDPVFFLGCPN